MRQECHFSLDAVVSIQTSSTLRSPEVIHTLIANEPSGMKKKAIQTLQWIKIKNASSIWPYGVRLEAGTLSDECHMSYKPNDAFFASALCPQSFFLLFFCGRNIFCGLLRLTYIYAEVRWLKVRVFITALLKSRKCMIEPFKKAMNE